MSTQSIAFFGATGDCAGWALAHALQDGHECRALARSREKLLDLMRRKGLSTDVLDKHLTIIQGNAKDINDVKRVLSFDGKTVDSIMFGIGMSPWRLCFKGH